MQGVDICETTWYKIIGVSRSMYMSYKSNSKWSCQFLPHGNQCTHKLRISTKQVESNVQSLIDLFIDIMPHQMKSIGNGRQDVQRWLPKSWKSLQREKWSSI